MAKLDLDSTNMKSNFIIPLNDVLNALNSALNYYNRMSIPSDFKKKSELKDIVSDLKNAKSKIKDLKERVVDSNSDYNELVGKLKDICNKIPDITIKQRSGLL